MSLLYSRTNSSRDATSKWGLKCVRLDTRRIVNKRNVMVYMVNDTSTDIIGISETWLSNLKR